MESSSLFEDFCAYWELFEPNGLNANVLASSEYLASPVLLMGSGQGLVSQALVEAGHDVTNVEISKLMIAYARTRRNIDAIADDAVSVSLGRQFETVIVSTGLLTSRNVRTRFIRDLVRNIDAHLTEHGHVLVAYLKRSFTEKAFEGLSLIGRPSNNHLFWTARESLAAVRERFLAAGYRRDLIDLLFVLCEEDLERHRQFIARLGTEYMRTNDNATPTREFLDKCADFAAFFLDGDAERALLNAIQEAHIVVRSFETDNGTSIIACVRTRT